MEFVTIIELRSYSSIPYLFFIFFIFKEESYHVKVDKIGIRNIISRIKIT